MLIKPISPELSGNGVNIANLPNIVTVEEAAKVLRLRSETLVKLLREGAVPGGFKVGGSWRLRKMDLVKLIEGQDSDKSSEHAA